MNNINNNNINEVQWPLKKFEDTKGLIRSRKQKEDRQKKMDKDTNYKIPKNKTLHIKKLSNMNNKYNRG